MQERGSIERVDFDKVGVAVGGPRLPVWHAHRLQSFLDNFLILRTGYISLALVVSPGSVGEISMPDVACEGCVCNDCSEEEVGLAEVAVVYFVELFGNKTMKALTCARKTQEGW
jgi:hypothetical protein